jgi:hypothetical protein
MIKLGNTRPKQTVEIVEIDVPDRQRRLSNHWYDRASAPVASFFKVPGSLIKVE